MPAQTPIRFLNSIHKEYPDDTSPKDVYLEAYGLSYSGIGPRHVFLWWQNAVLDDENATVHQIVQLTGQPGGYAYYSPVVQKQAVDLTNNHLQILLGRYTHTQRNQILQLADETTFVKTSVKNGCSVWTRDLFEAMVKNDLLPQEKIEEIDKAVPLVNRVHEVA